MQLGKEKQLVEPFTHFNSTKFIEDDSCLGEPKREGTSMSIWSMASNSSAWRGYKYYQQEKVASYIKVTEGIYEGDVEGAAVNPYHTVINTLHPRKSHCDCPFAKEHPNASCKHMVALLFTVFPDEAKAYMKEVEESEKEEERRHQAHLEDMRKHVNMLSKEELREELFNALLELEERDTRYW